MAARRGREVAPLRASPAVLADWARCVVNARRCVAERREMPTMSVGMATFLAMAQEIELLLSQMEFYQQGEGEKANE